MGRIEDLADEYERHLAGAWQHTLAGAQRVVFVVYPKDDERVLRARLSEFQQRTEHSERGGHRWSHCDCTTLFAQWMADDEYRDAYFEVPDDLRIKLDTEFQEYVASHVRGYLRSGDDAADKDTVVAITGLGSLYPFLHVSLLIRALEPDIQGRLVVFFPGSKNGTNFRFLDARDGFHYLGTSITLQGLGGVA
jgi:hypothetical protein